MPIIAIVCCCFMAAIACIAGWCMNIATLFHTMGGPIDGEFILRVVGIFAAPLGVVMGYI